MKNSRENFLYAPKVKAATPVPVIPEEKEVDLQLIATDDSTDQFRELENIINTKTNRT